MKGIKYFVFFISSIIPICGNIYAMGWKSDAVECVQSGKFAAADSILMSLSEDEVVGHEFEIDSLRQIMQRIRNDFNVTPQEGYESILQRVVRNISKQWLSTGKSGGFARPCVIYGS